jgi:hypothetical protein
MRLDPVERARLQKCDHRLRVIRASAPGTFTCAVQDRSPGCVFSHQAAYFLIFSKNYNACGFFFLSETMRVDFSIASLTNLAWSGKEILA